MQQPENASRPLHQFLSVWCVCVCFLVLSSALVASLSLSRAASPKRKKGVVAVRETKKYTVWQNEMSPPTPGFQTFPCFVFFFSSDVYRLYIRITKKRNLDRQSLLLPPTMYIHQQKELLQSNKSCALVYMLDRRKIGLLLRKLKGIFSFFLSFFGGNYGCAGKRQSNTTISAALCN